MMGLNLEKLKSKHVSVGNGWQPKQGANRIILLPQTAKWFTEEMDAFALVYNVHYFRSEGMDTQLTRCLRDNKEYCPACVVADRFKNADDPGLVKQATDLKRVERRLVNLFDVNEMTKGIIPYEIGWKIYSQLFEIISNPAYHTEGDPLNPQTALCWMLKFVPGNSKESRTGWNDYVITPEPGRYNIVPQLDTAHAQHPGG